MNFAERLRSVVERRDRALDELNASILRLEEALRSRDVAPVELCTSIPDVTSARPRRLMIVLLWRDGHLQVGMDNRLKHLIKTDMFIRVEAAKYIPHLFAYLRREP